MYANCKYPYWRFSAGKFRKYFFISYLIGDGVDNIEDLKLQNDNLKEQIKAKREGRKPQYMVNVKYRKRIIEPKKNERTRWNNISSNCYDINFCSFFDWNIKPL